MKISFINPSYRRFFAKHRKELMGAIESCLENGELTLREEVAEFERQLARFIGTKYAIGVASGTDALFLSLKALDVGPGDEVITVSHTFIAPIQAIVHCGATPVLIDVNEDELIDKSQLEKAITEKTKAIISVHLTGKVADYWIFEIARKHNIPVVEDVAQALGAYWIVPTSDDPPFYLRERAGRVGALGCFSFNTAKMMGAYGDAGAITTSDSKLAEKLFLLRNHWNMSQLSVKKEDFPQPEVVKWGWKSRLDNIQAAVLLVKMKYLEEIIARRAEIAKMYNEGIKGIQLPKEQEGQVWQEYHVRVENRDGFVEFMRGKDIELLVRDVIPNHQLKELGLEHFNLPVTEKLAKEIVRLPLYPEMTNKEVEYVINSINEYGEKH